MTPGDDGDGDDEGDDDDGVDSLLAGRYSSSTRVRRRRHCLRRLQAPKQVSRTAFGETSQSAGLKVVGGVFRSSLVISVLRSSSPSRSSRTGRGTTQWRRPCPPPRWGARPSGAGRAPHGVRPRSSAPHGLQVPRSKSRMDACGGLLYCYTWVRSPGAGGPQWGAGGPQHGRVAFTVAAS